MKVGVHLVFLGQSVEKHPASCDLFVGHLRVTQSREQRSRCSDVFGVCICFLEFFKDQGIGSMVAAESSLTASIHACGP